jgi:uncharacterized membrane protein
MLTNMTQMSDVALGPLVFYTILYRNVKLSMRFFSVKLHIEFTFHRCNPCGFGVACPWIFYISITKMGPLVIWLPSLLHLVLH